MLASRTAGGRRTSVAVTRKSNWLPGADQREPGPEHDLTSYNQVYPGRTRPIVDVISGVVSVVLAAALAIFIFGFVPNLNLVAVLIVGVGMLVFLGVGVFYLQRGGRRWAWRKRHIADTGGRYLRPWEKYQPSDWMH
jgi:hypothetical protein